ncbi:MAG: CCA tRNA nucleotidyltransferase [Candidatus Omnitrophica bacterium]|nr:CCA tRNA nucleotidyltransferase [Candidatus Omnitrophota bacterium]
MKNSSELIVNSSQIKNLAKLLERRLPANIFNIVRKIGRVAEGHGLSAYLVGGCVRDILLGVKNLDLDIVVEGDAIALAKLLKDRFKLDVVAHQRFGTATVTLSTGIDPPNSFKGGVLSTGVKIDIASSRKECYAYPASLPSVTLSSIRDDLFRRDFTINTLAIGINSYNFGQLLDLYDGQKDLRSGKIRVLHDKSFIDDPTRILRAIRFEQRYNFKIEANTFKLMRNAISLELLGRLTRPRLGREFILLLKEEKPLKAISRFDRLCGLKLIHPLIRLDKMARIKLKSPKPEDNWLVYFALLANALNKQQLEKLCCDFSLTRKDKQTLKTLRKEIV